MKRGARVFVGLSGGVDSSVAAYLLKKRGYDVTGIFIKVWQADFLPCNWKEERRDAMRVAAFLDIPFLTLDLEKEYKEGVVDHMIREYAAGRTPNPDVMCNKEVKFGAFLKFAKENDVDYVATGHYARVRKAENEKSGVKIKNSHYRLLRGADTGKDQSYFLWMLSQEQLTHILFPVGHLNKSDVRRIASRIGLPNAKKKDSQGLCFLGPVDIREFLRHFVTAEPGSTLDTNGKCIGAHEGTIFYTLGERHGFTVTETATHTRPLYVVAKDMHANTITVAEQIPKQLIPETLTLERTRLSEDIRFVNTKGVTATLRYRGKEFPVEKIAASRGGNVSINIRDLNELPGSGQSVVLYRGDVCLGGGIIV